MSIKKTKTGKSIYRDSDNENDNDNEQAYVYSGLLVFAILFCIYLCSLTLSAHQLHHSLQKISSDGSLSLSVERLGRFRDKNDDIEYLRDNDRDNLYLERDEISSLSTDISETKTRIIQYEADEDIAESETGIALALARITAEKARLENLEKNILTESCNLVKSAIAIDNDYISSLDNLFEQTGLGVSRQSVENDNSIQLALGGYVSLYDDLERSGNCDFPTIRRLKSYNVADKHLTQMLAEYNYFNPRDGAIENPLRKIFIKMPRSMLAITVVFLMGALGGLITLVRALLGSDDEEATVSYKAFLFTPILGAVTGFAIFVLAKAGVLIISDAGSEGGAYLSPFFVSFLGLISGLLSVDALDTMTDLGKKWFSSSAHGVERWCVDAGEIISDDKKVSVLAVLAGVPDEIFREWLRSEKPVPEHGQKIIAAAQSKFQGTIFTDIQPPKKPTQPQSG